MAERDWKEVTEALRESVRMGSYPVGVKMLSSAGELNDHKRLRLLRKTAPCHMAAMARYYREDGLVGASSQTTRCVWG
ncbi:MAG: hypothetical protein ACLFPN_05760, partial [Methanomassiliicoccales archaeon]